LPNEYWLKTPRAAGIAGVIAGSLFIASHVLILVAFHEGAAADPASAQERFLSGKSGESASEKEKRFGR
jgi:hypothetical protein